MKESKCQWSSIKFSTHQVVGGVQVGVFHYIHKFNSHNKSTMTFPHCLVLCKKFVKPDRL